MSDGTFERTFGGKGANQAAAAARLGAVVTFVGCVGDDDLGDAGRAELEARGVDCEWLQTRAGVATGTALINVDAAGENTVAVAPGANRFLDVVQIEAAIAAERRRRVVRRSRDRRRRGVGRVALRAGTRDANDLQSESGRRRGNRPLRAIVRSVVVNEVEVAAYGGPAAILAAGAD